MALLTGTLGNYITRVRRWIGEPTESKSRYSNNFIKQLFNSTYRLRCTELHMAFEGFFVSRVQRDITAEQETYAWPPNFQRLHKMELVRTDGKRIPIQRFERHDSPIYVPSAGGDSYCPTYRPIGSGFALEPAADETVTNGLFMEYYSIPVELEQDNDNIHPDFPAIFDELLVIDTVLALVNSEFLLDDGAGLGRTLEGQRLMWQEKWERYIDARMASSRNQIEPFIGHYSNS